MEKEILPLHPLWPQYNTREVCFLLISMVLITVLPLPISVIRHYLSYTIGILYAKIQLIWSTLNFKS